jgi:hypothetical protein
VLFAAVQHSNEDAVAMLLSAGANVNARDKKGEMSLLKAIELDNLTQKCCSKMALMSIQTNTGPCRCTAARSAYHRSNPMVNLLQQHVAQINARDSTT